MTIPYRLGGGQSPYLAGSSVAMNAARRAALAFVKDIVADGKAIWCESTQARLYRKAEAGDDPAVFQLYDRLGHRTLTPAPSYNRHPWIYGYQGKDWFIHGSGGSASNVLNQAQNGALTIVRSGDSFRRPLNKRQLIKPAAGWSFAAVYVLPDVVSGNALGRNFGASSGGCLFGGAGVTNADSLRISINSLGHVTLFNRASVVTNGQYLESGGDQRDGLPHTLLASWDPGLGRFTCIRDGGAPQILDGVAGDVLATAGCELPMIGGFGGNAGGVDDRLTGAWRFMSFTQGQRWTDPAARPAITDFMASLV